ncbi:hypothetical protein MTR67_039338 [Solanum verrucosum]|uniref:Retrotransposon gag domain-containing protein n=1 Tax=Solanum verrucosum TaxID=315347 RepID=A0AAF0UGR1_SOLVR|nr:hypothetical protein MTR67_039338 [Solanum verrucosum]
MVQVNRGVIALANNVNKIALRVREFLRLNPLEFHGSKVEEYSQGFIDEVYKVAAILGLTMVEKVELAAYQLRDIGPLWYEQWKDNRPLGVGPIEWERFTEALLDRFFPLELRERKMEEFMSLREGDMTVKEYALRFTQLSKYAPILVADSRARMNKPRTKPRYSDQDSSKSTCTKCGRSRYGKCLAGMDGFYGCANDGHKMRDCSVLKAKGREEMKNSSSYPNECTQKKNRFYALQYREYQE